MKFARPGHPVWKYLCSLPLGVKILALLGTMLALSLAVTLNLFAGEISRYQSQQQQQLAQQLGQQSAQIAASQMLAKDWVSLTVTANLLLEHPQIQGVEIVDQRAQSLAEAGQPGERLEASPIEVNDTPLGSLRIYLAPTDPAADLSLVFYRTSLAALVTLGLSWLTIWLYLRRLQPPLRQLLRAGAALQDNQPMPRITTCRNDELGILISQLNARFAPEPEPESAPVEDNSNEVTKAEPLTTENPSDQLQSLEVAANVSADQPTPPLAAAAASPATPASAAPPTTVAAATRYLLYVDHCSTASDNLTLEERSRLLEPYRRHLEQVSRLYKGQFSLDEDGNWWVGFSPLDNEQSHGINALCAAQLFNALYRGTNQRAILQMTPVANIKMTLLCGEESFEGLLEEAAPLCRAVEANQLIVDEQLFAIPQLVERLLQDAQCRTLEQPARLLTSLGPDYQALIDQQAEHFLNQK